MHTEETTDEVIMLWEGDYEVIEEEEVTQTYLTADQSQTEEEVTLPYFPKGTEGTDRESSGSLT